VRTRSPTKPAIDYDRRPLKDDNVLNGLFHVLTNRSSRRHIIRSGWIVLLAVILAGFTALFSFLLIDQRYQDWKQAEISALNVTTSVQRDVLQTFQGIDRTLMAVRELVAADADFKFDPQRRRAFLGDTSTASGLGEIYILDRKGAVILRSETGTRIPGNLANQPFFFTHERTSEDRLFTAKTMTLSPLGEMVVMMSRRMTDSNGDFAGVIAFSLRLSTFADLFGSLDLGEHGSISLYGTEGTLLLRAPAEDGMIGKNYLTSPIFWQLVTATAPFSAPSPVDGLDRLFSAAKVGDLPLVLAIGLSTADIYGGWKQLAITTSIFFAALAGCVIFLSVLLGVELRRRKRSESRYRTLAHVDGLTGLFNRRRFDSVLETEFSRAQRRNAPLSVVMIDVDRFKFFNDLYGHQAGDDCLRLIAQAIQAHLKRPADIAARYGGEEIGLILPDTDEAGAAAIAETVRFAIESLAITHARSDCGFITASLGTATARPGLAGAPIESSALVAIADAALYWAKRSGRNRVIDGRLLQTGIPAPLPANEKSRADRVKATLVAISNEDRAALDRITQMAAKAFRTKTALVSLVDTADQFFVGRTGLATDSTGRDVSFCAYALGGGEAFVVLDAAQDIRFAGNALVTGTPHIRFYAGAPLCDPETGSVLGTLCIIDPAPRAAFSDNEHDLLLGFAALALEQLNRIMRGGTEDLDIAQRASA